MAVITDSGRKALLLRGYFDGGEMNLWTGYGDLIWDGVTYRGAGQILSVSGTASTSGSSLSGVTVTISGIDYEAIAIAETEPFQRRRVDIYLAAFDSAWQVAEVALMFSGLADSMPDNGDPSNPRLTLSVEPRALDLQTPRPFYYTPEDQYARYSGDRIFDMVQDLMTEELTLGSG